MTFRSLILGGAALIALGATALSIDAESTAALARTVATAPARQTVPINTVTNATASLAKMRVENAAGESVGTVVDVVTQADGKAIALTVDVSVYVGKHRWIGIQAGKLGLDQGRRVLVTSLTKAEIKALPNLA